MSLVVKKAAALKRWENAAAAQGLEAVTPPRARRHKRTQAQTLDDARAGLRLAHSELGRALFRRAIAQLERELDITEEPLCQE